MNSFFFDSSALVKRYVREAGSEEVDDILSQNGSFYVSWLTYGECQAAFARLFRSRVIKQTDYTYIENEFHTAWSYFAILRETRDLEKPLRQLIQKQPLRGADAIQLASSIYLREHGISTTFVCSDRMLSNIAQEEGLKTVSPGLV